MHKNDALFLLIDTYHKQLKKHRKSKKNSYYLSYKVQHTYWVVEIAKKIILIDPVLSKKDKSFKDLAEIWCLLHDIWRFFQVETNEFNDGKHFDHGDVGYSFIRKHFSHKDDIFIALSIKHHNKQDIKNLLQDPLYKKIDKETDKQLTMLLLKIVRDADKLDNFKEIVYTDGAIIDNLFSLPTNGITNNVLEKYLKTWKIYHEDVKTREDNYINILSRKNDLNFVSSKKIFQDIGFEQFIYRKLHELWVDKKTLSTIFWKISKK